MLSPQKNNMEKEFESRYHELEENHWWFKARRDILMNLIEKFPKESKILDIGCSGGALIKKLEKIGYTNCTGVDISEKAIKLCKSRGIKNCYLMDGGKISFNEKFDFIIASDVLEHIKDDKKAVQTWKKVLAKNGRIICFVPAFSFLWSHHDAENQHYRRYERNKLLSLFKSEKIVIERLSYWNFFLFFPVAIIRLVQNNFFRGSYKSQLKKSPSLINSFLYYLLNFENDMLKHFNLPIGISIFLIAKDIN